MSSVIRESERGTGMNSRVRILIIRNDRAVLHSLYPSHGDLGVKKWLHCRTICCCSVEQTREHRKTIFSATNSSNDGLRQRSVLWH